MHIGGHVCRYPRLAGVSRAAGRLRPRDVMTWQAVPGPPVELSHGGFLPEATFRGLGALIAVRAYDLALHG